MKSKKKQFVRILGVLSLCFVLNTLPMEPLQAQCPMCRMSAESNLKNGGTAGAGLNKGILYMLATPYVIIGTIGFLWWRNRRKEEEFDEVQT